MRDSAVYRNISQLNSRRSFSAAILVVCCLVAVDGRCDEEVELSPRVRRLRAMEDGELLKALSKPKLDAGVLAEVVRRGSTKWTAHIQSRYQTAKKTSEKRAKNDEFGLPREMNDELLLLSAHHRLSGESNPVPIEIKGKSSIELVYPEMPMLDVAVVNKHPQKQTVTWSEGGNYRHGRRESFSFEVKDAKGKTMPIVTPTFLFGGLVSNVELRHGEAWTASLTLGTYIKTLPPGKYTLRATYAFGRSIGTIQDKTTSFMCYSKPIKLVVMPREIVDRADDHRRAKALLEKLDVKSTVRVLAGEYDPKEDKDFIAPDSPAGQLLQMKWSAVPTLIAALSEKDIKPTKRARIFALLFSLTGVNDPRDFFFTTWDPAPDGVLGNYEYRSRGWVAFIKLPGGDVTGGMGFSGNGSSAGKINVENQLEFVKRWMATKKHYRIIRPKMTTRD
jgi:hypothetical protein